MTYSDDRDSWDPHGYPRMNDDFSAFMHFLHERSYVVCETNVGDNGCPEKEPVTVHRLYAEWLKHRGYAAPYDDSFGDDRVCRCGHTYYRHFDTYEDMFPIGCKYCNCNEFVPERSKMCKDCHKTDLDLHQVYPRNCPITICKDCKDGREQAKPLHAGEGEEVVHADTSPPEN